MNIAITIHLENENESVWVNGIKQNAIYLLKLLKSLDHNAYLVNTSTKISAPFDGKVQWDVNELPIRDYLEAIEETDVLIFLGSTFPDNMIDTFKNTGKNKKVIRYACGTNYIIDMENVLFQTDPESETGYNQNLDEIWYIPQQTKLNAEYLRVIHNLPADKVKVVPFIWDPMFIDKTSTAFNNPDIIKNIDTAIVPIYMPGKPNIKKQISCFEPNLNVVKFSMIPTLIVEDYFNKGGEFNKFTIFGGDKLIKQKYYPSILKDTKLFKSDPVKISYQHRMIITLALAKSTDIVIAHQWENPLNYAYLDALYLQYPLVHNATYIQDAGYYYPDFNIGEGAKQLKLAMDKHDKHIDKYNAKSEDVLTRYTVYNEDMVALYGKLLDNLVTPGTHELSHRYDWKTNTYL